MTYIEKYIELQRIRSSNGQYVQFSKQLDNEHQSIAPMLFIPFIENAFKYSETFKSEKAVIIQLELLNGKLKFICKNWKIFSCNSYDFTFYIISVYSTT